MFDPVSETRLGPEVHTFQDHRAWTWSVSEDRLGPEVHAPSPGKVPGQTLTAGLPDRAITYGLTASRSTFTPGGKVGASASR